MALRPAASSWAPDQPWVFERTPWSRITEGFSSETAQGKMIEGLCRRYWSPVHSVLRAKGYSDEDAKDLTQAYFAQLLHSGAMEKALDATRGSFRGFLRTSLGNFVINHWKKNQAAKRGGGAVMMSLDDEESAAEELAASAEEPAVNFDKLWAESIIKAAREALEKEMRDCGRASLYEVLRPLLSRPPRDGEYLAIREATGMGESAVAMNVLRFRKRFRELVEELVAESSPGKEEAKDNLTYLIKLLTSR